MIVLGSTGSIGVNTLWVAQRYALDVELLSAHSNVALLNAQIKAHSPKYVVIGSEHLRCEVAHDKVFVGEAGLLEAMRLCESDTVVNALVGFAGLPVTLEALKLGKRVALANKESLVAAGAFIDTSKIVPIDSEHFALSYLVQDKPMTKMTITASGGSFRDYPLDALQNVTVDQALAHPNWSMGRKITIDSATMTNKLFELLEAKWLFPSVTQFDAVIETKSLIHAFVEFADGSTTAHFAYADMKLPIAYAVMGRVDVQIVPSIDFGSLGGLEFRPITPKRYPIWEIKEELLKSPHLGVVVNAANEVAVAEFLEGKIPFLEVSRKTLRIFEHYVNAKIQTIEDVFGIDKEIREKYKEDFR